MLRDQHLVEEVEILLPSGETARFRLHGQHFSYGTASCFVVSNAGEAPDTIICMEIHAEVTLAERTGSENVVIRGGSGIGRVTKPGLGISPGEWAINPMPRKMIAESITEVFPLQCPLLTTSRAPLVPHVTISIPNGRELAKKTRNERLGIIGGLAILETTGILTPISAKAWTGTIDTAVDVAVACNCSTLVLSADRNSEEAAQRHLLADSGSAGQAGRADATRKGYRKLFKGIRDESYIMMGDHVGHAIRSGQRKEIRYLILAAPFDRVLKIACGHEQTHVPCSQVDLDRLRVWLGSSRATARFAVQTRQATTARQVLEATGGAPGVIALVATRAAHVLEQLVPSIRVKVLLAGYGGEVLYFR